MNQPTRSGLLKNAAKAAIAVGGGAILATSSAKVQVLGKLEKKRYPKPVPGENALFSPAVSYGNLLFLSGVGSHFKGTIEQHTLYVVDQISRRARARTRRCKRP